MWQNEGSEEEAVGLLISALGMSDRERMIGKVVTTPVRKLHQLSEIFHFPSLRSKRHQNKTHIEERL